MYSPDSLNRYTQRTVPGFVEAFGKASTDADVSVNGETAQRLGEGWYRRMPVENSGTGTWVRVNVSGVRAGGGPAGADAIAAGTRQAWVRGTPEQFIYDADGNLTRDGEWVYSWDGENRLIACETNPEIVPPAGVFPMSERRKLEFVYDSQGRRIAKLVSNWAPSGWVLVTHTFFVYDGWNMVAELNALAGNAPLRTYVWGLDLSGTAQGAGGVSGLLFANLVFPAGGSYAPAFDGNGNVVGYVDMTNGVRSATYEYSAFGETLVAEGPMHELLPFRFSTKYTDNETDLLYYGFRYYNASAGRWLSRDPIEEPGHEAVRAIFSGEEGAPWQNDFASELLAPEVLVDDVAPFAVGNAYLGMRNNPLSYVDPDGRNPVLLLRALLLKLLKDRAKKIAECEAIHRSYEVFKDKCRSCKGCTVKAEAQKNTACYAAEVAGRALYLKKRCDYVLLGSISRGSKLAEDGHKKQLVEKTAALAICTAKAASLPDPTPTP